MSYDFPLPPRDPNEELAETILNRSDRQFVRLKPELSVRPLSVGERQTEALGAYLITHPIDNIEQQPRADTDPMLFSDRDNFDIITNSFKPSRELRHIVLTRAEDGVGLSVQTKPLATGAGVAFHPSTAHYRTITSYPTGIELDNTPLSLVIQLERLGPDRNKNQISPGLAYLDHMVGLVEMARIHHA
jgi:hypothetical protein